MHNINYNEYKVTDTQSSGKLANFITFKNKELVLPGQYFMVWVPGFGNAAIPISNHKKTDTEILLTKNTEIERKLFHLKKKNTLFLNGPCGHGFAMNNLKDKNIVFIGQTKILSPLWSAYEHISKNKKRYKNLSFIVYQSKPKKAFLKKLKDSRLENVKLSDIKEKFLSNIKNIKTKKDNYYLLSLDEDILKETINILQKKGARLINIYFYLHRKIHCGKGLCGKCMIYGFNVCTDGPVFRADKLNRLIKDD